MASCPFCHEPLEEGLKTCPFCGKPLEVFASVAKPEKKPKWYHSPVSLVIGFFMIGPFVLPAVWSHPRYNRTTKIVLSAVILGFTALIIKSTIGAFKEYMKVYSDILNGTY